MPEMTGSASPPRLLMVEFTALGRFILGIEYPFIFSLLKNRLNLPVRWVRFGLDPAVQFQLGEEGIGLEAADQAALLQTLADFQPTQVLFSHQPAPSLWKRMRTDAPRLSGRQIQFGPEDSADRTGAGEQLPEYLRNVAELLEWLGIPPGKSGLSRGTLFEDMDPDFGFTAGNPAARQADSLGFIHAGAECAYRRSVARNPAYQGMDLTGFRTTGCAFCVSGGGQRPWKGSAARRALRQIAAFVATYPFPSPAARAGLRLMGYQVLRDLVKLATDLRAIEQRGLDLLMDARPDTILKYQDRLGRAAEILAGSGHQVHVCLVGVENFSAPELLRMNKGIRPWQNLAAIRALRELERLYPATFGFRQHGGLSTILFTPWTRPEDLALNIAVVRHFGLRRVLGKFPSSRLRLYAGIPMTALARRDGLLVEAYDDPALDTARRNFYPDELPWRFFHPQVDPISRIAARMTASPELARDPLYQRVQAWLHAPGPGQSDELEKISRVVDRTMAVEGDLTVEQLLDPTGPTRSASGPSPASRPAAVAGSTGIPPEETRLVAIQRAGLNRVNRMEGLARAAAEAARQRLERQKKTVVLTGPDGGAPAGDRLEVFFGDDPAEVEEAARLTWRLQTSDSLEERIRARQRIGELFGYPSCCARSFAQVEAATPNIYEWLILLRRCEHPGPIPPLLNPFGLINHVPCSYECQPSLQRAAAIREVLDPQARDRETDAVSQPVLFLLDRPGERITLVPRRRVGRSFRFSAGLRTSDDPRLQALDRGGTLDIEEGAIQVSRGGQRVASFCLTAALFWHQKAFDPEFWRLCAQEALDPWTEPERTGAGDAKSGECAPAVARPATSALADRIRAHLLSGSGPSGPLAGLTVRSVEPSLGRYVEIALLTTQPSGPELILHVEPVQGAVQYFQTVGDRAVSYSDATPLDSPERQQALQAVITHLASLS